MTTSIQIVFYSMYGHIYTMAEAVAEGVRSVDGCSAELLQVPELMPDAVLEKYGAKASRDRNSLGLLPSRHYPSLVGHPYQCAAFYRHLRPDDIYRGAHLRRS